MTVDELHRELGFDEIHAAQLRQIKGLWRQLLTLQRAAQKDARQLDRYRAYLRTAIARIKQVEAEAWTPEQAIDALVQFQAEYEARRAKQADRARCRGRTVEDWMDRWQPEIAKRFTEAYLLALNEPSSVTLQRLREAADVYFQVYELS
jgi:hypothetical protein